jgi:SAM-dependent methyltransferase
VISSKELLSKYNVLDENPKPKKGGAHHEFQAFAYKLAKDLNDLVNLKMYMHITKNVERSMIEKAYSYAIDSHSDNRAKVFMWKIKELRLDLKRYRDSLNFDYDFVIKKMKTFRDRTFNAQLKSYLEIRLELVRYFLRSVEENPKGKVLVLTTPSIELLSVLIDKFKKVYYWDLSKEINNKLEIPFIENHKKITFKRSDFLKSKYKEGEFDLIICDAFWNFLPQDAELKFLELIKSILKPTGKFVISTRYSEVNKQEWKTMKLGEGEIDYFTKTSTASDFEEKVSKMELKISHTMQIDSNFIWEISGA